MRWCVLLALTPSLAFAQVEDATYRPTAARVEAGAIVFAGQGNLWGVGGTISAHYAIGEQRLFFFGGRLALLGGAESGFGGFGGIADVDVGLRPRVVTGRTGAFAWVFALGVGGAFISEGHSALGLFHLTMRLGPGFDIGAFTLEALAGPAMLASDNGAAAAVECILDVGARF